MNAPYATFRVLLRPNCRVKPRLARAMTEPEAIPKPIEEIKVFTTEPLRR
jgi:hypothetical protein